MCVCMFLFVEIFGLVSDYIWVQLCCYDVVWVQMRMKRKQLAAFSGSNMMNESNKQHTISFELDGTTRMLMNSLFIL